MQHNLNETLLTILNHVLQTEVIHYEESGEPENHIYALALEAKVMLATATN